MTHEDETVEEILKRAIQKSHIYTVSTDARISELEKQIVQLQKRIKELEF